MKIRTKKIAVLMDGSAFTHGKAAEAMRMAVGLTLRNPGVHLYLMNGGAKALESREPYPKQQALFMEHLNAYLDLGCPLVLEESKGGRPRDLLEGSGMEARTRKEMIREITESDFVILLDGAGPIQEASKRTPEPSPEEGCHEGILHIVRKTPGSLFHQVVESQRRARRLTIVLLPGAKLEGLDLPGEILELGRGKRENNRPGLPSRIGYQELLDLIFEHERIFCW